MTSWVKPADLHARDWEWQTLSDFAVSDVSGASLGLVYGRRRQGKTLLLELLAEASGGFMYGAQQQTEAQNLADLGVAYARHVGAPAPVSFADWRHALDALLALEGPVIIDEFPYLVSTTPALPSQLQLALSPWGAAKREGRSRLILCGSALSTMRGLLSGGAPLRGRATMELLVRPFWFREAAGFWGLSDDPDLAFRVHALVGGTPAYLEMSGGAPRSARDFDAWVCRALLSPASAMFREGNLLLREEPEISDPTSYASVLTAVSMGRIRRTEIAATLGRPATAIAHPLAGLEDIGLLERVEDAFKSRRGTFRISDPVVRLHQLVISRDEGRLVRREAERVWAEAADTVASKMYGPHLEDLAREWVLSHADVDTLGGRPSWVRPATLSCREHQQGHELDIVAMRSTPFDGDHVLAIGEVKATGKPMDLPALERLIHLRDLAPSDRVRDLPRILMFSRAGFTKALLKIADDRQDLELVDMTRLYQGN
ncbi:AAA family ATPase [Longispora fulva]|uniref:AAA+ ATPase superfamily predicted ATPase n=1 Tax=Longispora fulva TaxID=619741 RepID=A0A8J7KPS3_9ACTN|nr:ATP-binding protein [Longispora fulva]MBG6141621.1 AAA+ ATPase superfamily predicted ATPase [Longispora fulva]